MKKKVLILTHQKQINHFYRHLFLYRSFLYHNIYFMLKEENEEIEKIITALNMKKRKERLLYVYEEACHEIDSFYQDQNICGFQDGKCYVQRKKNLDSINGCCRMCRFQSSKGCQTMNLACKLFFCSEVKERYKTLTFDDIHILKVLAKKERLIISSNYFSSKKEVLKDIQFNSLCIAIIRIGYRLIPTFIKKRLSKT